MGWDSKPSYPPGAHLKVPVRATDFQKSAWEAAAQRHGMASAGAFLAWAGDLYIAMQRAYQAAVLAHDDALNPVGYAEEERRRREREGEP